MKKSIEKGLELYIVQHTIKPANQDNVVIAWEQTTTSIEQFKES